MSSETPSIDAWHHPTPPVSRAPSSPKPSHEEEVFLHTPKEGKASRPLTSRLIEIPRQCLAFFKDESWMSLIVDFFGIASRSFDLIGNIAGNYVPYLSIASSPFYLYHALKNSKERFKLMHTAAKTSRVAETIFWLGRALDSTGSAISDIAKPFAGGFALAGLTTKHFALGVAFTVVIPIVLIVCGAIGGIAQGWAGLRTRKVLKGFNEEVDKQDGSLKALADTLTYLQGPNLIGKSREERVLEERHFNDTHFTNSARKEAIQARIISALGDQDLIHSHINFLAQNNGPQISELKLPVELLEDIQPLLKSLLTEDKSEYVLVDETLQLYERLLNQLDSSQDLYREVEQHRDEVAKLKERLLIEGGKIIDTVRSEIHRQLCYHAIFVLMATLTLVAGVMILSGHYSTVGYGLALGSSSLSLIYVLFDKCISQKTFYNMHNYLHNLSEKKAI